MLLVAEEDRFPLTRLATDKDRILLVADKYRLPLALLVAGLDRLPSTVRGHPGIGNLSKLQWKMRIGISPTLESEAGTDNDRVTIVLLLHCVTNLAVDQQCMQNLIPFQ